MEIKQIPLHHIHTQLGAKMVPFAGYHMPVRYTSDREEHFTVRENVGVFDVSHMGEFAIRGPLALDLIQRITTNDAARLVDGQAQYTCMPNGKGGIVDDLIVYRHNAESYMLVVNASNIEKDWSWISRQNAKGAEMENLSDDIVLYAVQGPIAQTVLQRLTSIDLSEIKFYHFALGEMAGIPEVIISATGYTGAGGFELYVRKEHAVRLWNALFDAGQPENIKPIGLAARDTLRLEMGYCLYGNDIDESTSPIEAGLSWITKFTKSFIDDDYLKQQKADGVGKKLCGLVMDEKGIPRPGYTILNSEGKPIGKVTSGTISPILEKGIALGYLETAYAAPGSRVAIEVRNKKLVASVQRPPFIQ